MPEIIIPYSPRPIFQDFHSATERWSIMVCHRRAGKTVAHINKLIRAAVSNTRKDPPPSYAYVGPYMKQAKRIAWAYLKHYAGAVPELRKHETELWIEFPHNKARIAIYGADDPDNLRGVYFDGVVMDEFAQMNPDVWTQVLRPTLNDYKGWASFIGTPKGKNAFWRLWQYGDMSDDAEKRKPRTGWFKSMLKASETGIIAPEELEDAKLGMSDDEYLQEYECSFEAAIRGAYYGELMTRATEEGRICRVPWEPVLEVHTAWDLGIGDATAIWFCQQTGRETRLIDYYESSGAGLDHYVKKLKEKPYVYGKHYLPHDAAVRDLSMGKSRVEMLISMGVTPYVIPRQPIDDGIANVRNLLPMCWFDAGKCAIGLEHLRNYRKEWDAKRRTFMDKPLHDAASHGADSFRTLAMGLRRPAASMAPIDYNPNKRPSFYV
jgi:hypothetical protein